MKKYIENGLADIIFKLPEKPFSVWILLIIVQAFQLIQTCAYLMHRLYPNDLLYDTMYRIIGLFTLRPIQQQFPMFCFFIQAIYIVFLILLIIKFIIGKPQVGAILNYCEIWCPVLITISIQSLGQFPNLVAQIMSFFTAITSIILWALRLMVLCQDYVSRNAKFTSIKSTIRMTVFCFQSVILYFELTNTLVIVFIGVSSGLLLIAFVLSLVIIENVDEQLQYLHHLKCACATSFYVSIIFVQFMNQHGYLLVASLLFAFICERLGVWKFIFEIKYNILLDRVNNYQGDEDLIVLLGIVGGTHTLKPNGVQNLRGRAQSYWTNKQIQFNFHSKAKSICMSLAVKRAKQLGQQIQCQNIIKQQTFAVIEDYMTKKIKAKSKLLPFVMVSQCIKRQLLIKALSIHSSIVGQLDFNQRILKKVLMLRISHFSNSKDKMGSIYQLTFGLCCLNKIILTSWIDQVIEHQNIYENFLKLMIQISGVTNRLLGKLTPKIIQTNKIMAILQEKFILKSKLNHYTQKDHTVISKQIISLFYIYYTHFCSQKFSAFRTLNMCFIALQQISLKSSKDLMICLVSAAHNNRGSIINANHIMVEFFGFDFEHIKQNLTHIEDILPRPLAVIHNNLISRCLQTGLSTIISSITRFFIVKNNTAFPVQFQVKFQPFIEGINFSCEIKLINSQNFVLFDKQNEIVGFSQPAKWILPKKKIQSKYISQIFGNIRKTLTKLPRASQQSIFSKADGNNPFATHKQIMQQKRYQTTLEFYRTIDFQLGICKFLKVSLQSTKNISTQSQVFIHVVEQSNKSQVKITQENNQFLILEKKISSMSSNIPLISKFKIIIVVYAIMLILVTTTFFVIIHRSIQSSQILCQYQNTLFHNSPQQILLAIDRITNLYKAGYSNLLNFSEPIHYNVTIKEFLSTQYSIQLDSFHQLKYRMYESAFDLSTSMMDILTTKTLKQKILSGRDLELPLNSFLSYTMEKKIAISGYSPQQWLTINSTHPHTILMNATLLQMQNNVFQAVFSSIDDQKQSIRYVLIFLLVFTGVMAAMGIVTSVVILNRIVKQKKKYMSLLAETDNKYLNSKLKINQELTTILSKIMKSSLNDLVVSENTQTVQFKYGPTKSSFNRNIIMISDDKASSNGKTLNNKNYNYQDYLVLIIIMFIFLPIIGNILMGFFTNFMNTVDSSVYYQEFIKINNKVSKCAGTLLNVNTMLIAKNNNPIFNMSREQLYSDSYQCIINRETQSKLKDFVPLISKDKSIQTAMEDYLYLSKCDPDDTYCQQILSGAITRGIPSALLSYTTLATTLYNGLTNESSSKMNAQKMKTALQTIQSFTYYIRYILQMSDFVLSKIKSIFNVNKANLLYLIQSTILLEVALNIIFLIFIFRSRRQIYQLKKQIFTILPVDILVQNINFNFEIRNLD